MPNNDPIAAVSPQDLTSVLQSLKATLPHVFAAVTKQINIANITAQSGAVGQISVAQIGLGNVTVGSTKLFNISASLNAGSAFLENVSMNLELQFQLHWWYDIAIYSDSGDSDLGSLWFGMNLGNVTIPSLSNIQMAIPAVAVGPVTATVPPVSNFSLNGASMTGLKVTTTTLPTPGFSLNGMNLGTVKVSEVGVPGASMQTVAIEGFKPSSPIVVPSATVGGINVPSTAVPDVHSGAFNTNA